MTQEELQILEELKENISRYKAFSNFIFESMNVDFETTSITIQHPTKGEYPVYMKTIDDNLEKSLEKLEELLDS